MSGEAADRALLEFVAAHDFVVVGQARRVVDEDQELSAERVRRVVDEGLLTPVPRLRGQEGAYRITGAGLKRLGSDLPKPEFDVRSYFEQIGHAWLWIAADRGLFGPVEKIYSRRRMQAADAVVVPVDGGQHFSTELQAKLVDTRFALSAGGRTHYPGLMLVIPHGRVAMELLLSRPSRRWATDLLDGYAEKPQVTVTVILTLARDWLSFIQEEIDRRGMTTVQLREFRLAGGWL